MVRRSTPQAAIDGRAYPVRLRMLVPEMGFSALGRDHDVHAWLRDELGLGEYALLPDASVFGDACALHLRSVDAAAAFVRRFPQIVLADDTMARTWSSPHAPFGRQEESELCNLYSQTRSQDAVRAWFPKRPPVDRLGNLAPQPAIYPDQLAPIVRERDGERELVMARWGLPTPPQHLAGKKTDRGVTNVRNTLSPHWRRWLGAGHRCLVPFDRFAEPRPGGGAAWFEVADERPAFFAGLHVPQWTSVRKLKDGETTDDLYAFLTCPPNAEVAAVHPRAMPVILIDPMEWETWLTAPWPEAKALQRPLPDGALRPAPGQAGA